MDDSMRWMMVVAALGAAACGGGGSSSDPDTDMCEALCPGYVACWAKEGSAPLFCDEALASECERSCGDAAARLGDSHDAFLACAGCVVDFEVELCDPDAVEATAVVACPDECDDPRVAAAAEKFYVDLLSSFEPAADSAAAGTCDDAGTLTWAASDPAIGHDMGSDLGGGAWGCEGGGECGWGFLFYGPYVTLPPGDYVAGYTSVSALGAPAVAAATLEVYDGSYLAESVLDGPELQGTLEVRFTLTAPAGDIEIRLAPSGDLAGLDVGGVYIRRVGAPGSDPAPQPDDDTVGECTTLCAIGRVCSEYDGYEACCAEDAPYYCPARHACYTNEAERDAECATAYYGDPAFVCQGDQIALDVGGATYCAPACAGAEAYCPGLEDAVGVCNIRLGDDAQPSRCGLDCDDVGTTGGQCPTGMICDDFGVCAYAL